MRGGDDMTHQLSAQKHRGIRFLLAALCAVAIGRGDAFAFVWVPAQTAPQTTSSQPTSISADQLDSLVAPIALYPDPLLAQTLAASTYPLEIMQLQQWLVKNPGLTGQALASAVATQPWDPSVQAMAALPDVVKQLADNIQWTTDLGNAFIAQEAGVMDAVQRMRQRAEGTGKLQTTEQQVVETRVVENRSVIVIEPSNPDVVYVPSYNPAVVWGPPVYPYPPIYYPSAGYYAAGAAISFGVGMAVGSFWGHNGWGWNTGWGHNNINVNRNNAFVRNGNINSIRNGTFNNTWQHNAARGQFNRQSTGNLSGARSGAVGTAGRRAGAVGTTGMSAAGQNQFRSGSANRAAGVDRGAVQSRSGSVNRNYAGGANRSNFSGTTGVNRGSSSSGANRGSFNGNRGGYSGNRSGSFSGSRGGGSRGGGGGGRRGGGGGRRR